MRPSVVKIANWVVTRIINPRIRHSGRINWSQQDISPETFCMVSDAISVCCTLLNKVLEEHLTRFTNFFNSLETRPYNFPKFLSLRSHKWCMATTLTTTLVLKRCKTLIIFKIMNLPIEILRNSRTTNGSTQWGRLGCTKETCVVSWRSNLTHEQRLLSKQAMHICAQIFTYMCLYIWFFVR